ncbi:MAG: O-antigen ligase family protein [Thermoleophilia bacterium]
MSVNTAVAASATRFTVPSIFWRLSPVVPLAAGLLLVAGWLSPLFFLLLMAGLGVSVVSARYSWFSAALPVLVFNLVGTDLASGLHLAGIDVNAVDIVILPSLVILLWRVATGSRPVPRPGLAISMLAAWLTLQTFIGLIYHNPLGLVRNELHVLLFLPLAYFWVAAEIRTRRSLWLMLAAIIVSVALAGVKAMIISFFVVHTHSGVSSAWQAWTDISNSVGGERTRLSGADTMFMLAVPLLAAAALFAPRCRTTFFLLSGSSFVLFGLLASLTRTYWLGAFTAFVLVLGLGAVKAGMRAVTFTAVVAIAMAAAQILLVVLATRGTAGMDFRQILPTRLSFDNKVAVSQNVDYRGKEAAAFLQAAQRHLFLGSGLGAAVQLEYLGDQYPITTRDGHDIALDVLYKSGVLGIILFSFPLVLTTWRAVRGYLVSRDPLINMALLGVGLSLPLLIITSLTVNRLSHFEGAFFIGLAIAVVEIAPKLARQAPADTAGGLPGAVM